MLILSSRVTTLRPPDLLTAEILYHLPDYPALLQSFVWQDYDISPNFPALRRFIEFWEREIEGKIHSVTIASRKLAFPFTLDAAGAEYTVN